MGVFSGDFGVVNGVSTCMSWEVSEEESSNTYKASNTRGATGRTKGITRWSGSYNAKGAVPASLPREALAFQGFVSPDDGIEGNQGTVLSGTAIIDSVTIDWNWENGEPISHSVEFSSDGTVLTQDINQTALTDATVPAIDDVCVTKLEYAPPTGTFVELSDLISASLSLTADNKAYSNSSTNCIEAKVKNGIDATLSVERQSHQHVLALGSDFEVRVYTTATLFWLLKFLRFNQRQNKTVDIESGDIISYTKNFEMTSHAGAPLVLGSIEKPDSSVYWPFT